MKALNFLIILTVSVTLSACAENQNNQKQTIGTILGAGLGALVGSQIGDGKGKLVAVALGTIGGAFAGSQLGQALDDLDRLKANETQQSALENNKDGVSSSWKNPNTGNSGSITPTRTTRKEESDEDCRGYEHEIIVGGQKEMVKGTACRKSDGSWRVIN
jgi:surface antigen